MRVWRHEDRGLSDIVGTIVLLGITVTLAGVAVAGLYSATHQASSAPPRLDVKVATVSGNNTAILLTHGSGVALPYGDLKLSVAAANGTLYSSGKTLAYFTNSSGSWNVGTSVPITLDKPLAGGEHLDVQIIDAKLGTVIASGVLDVAAPGASGPAPTFGLTVVDPTSPPTVAAGSAMHVAVLVTHSEGRKAVQHVYLDLSNLTGSRSLPLYDDGTNGDNVSGDMVYSAYVLVPPEAANVSGAQNVSAYAFDWHGTRVSSAAITVNVVPPGFNINGNLTNVTITNVTYLNGGNSSTGSGGSTFVSSTFQNISNFGGTNQTFVNDTFGNFTATNLTNPTFGNVTNLTILTQGAVFGSPTITSISPLSGSSSTQITVRGTNLLSVSSAGLIANSTVYGASLWWTIDNSTMQLYASSSTPPGTYNVRVAGVAGNATSAQSFALSAVTVQAPGNLTLAPNHGKVGDTIVVSGQNLDTVRRVTLVNGTMSFVSDTTWWLQGTSINMVIPLSAAPNGSTPVNYTVELTGTAGAPTDVPQQLRVDVEPAPVINFFLPTSGMPWTQVNVFGQNFVNVQTVQFNGTSVFFATVSPTQLLVVTHDGLAPGYYAINVTTTTGSNQTGVTWGGGLFHALPAPIIPVYPAGYLSYFAIDMNKVTSGTLWGFIKFQTTNNWVVKSGSTQQLQYYPYQDPPDSGVVTMAQSCSNSGTSTYVYYPGSSQNATAPFKWAPMGQAFRFYFNLALHNTATNQDATISVTTTAQSQTFDLAPSDMSMLVTDHGHPTTGDYTSCSGG